MKKLEEEKIDLNGWMNTFSDLLNLLLTFFVLLFAMKSMDSGKLRESLGYFRQGGIGALELGQKSSMTPPKVMKIIAAGKKDFSPSDLRKLIDKTKSGAEIHFSSDRRGTVMTLSDEVLFEPGRSELSQEGKLTIEEISEVIHLIDKNFRIVGHTDNIPISTKRFSSNLELSIARAIAVIDHILLVSDLRPERFSAAGYADFHPLVPNDSPENRAKNRRVEIVFLNW